MVQITNPNAIDNEFTPEQQAWIDKLKSGKYKQGQGQLKRKNSKGKLEYCCLGIAASCVLKISNTKDELGNYVFNFGGPLSLINLHRCEPLRLHDGTGSIEPILDYEELKVYFSESIIHRSFSLTELNDNGATFKEIGAFIERNPWRVFKNFDNPNDKKTKRKVK